jgi:HPt (histidine-containing phosphotransfer) domain-containing protein
MHFDLWLVDANLPDGRGETMLEERRDGTGMPALAHTAASDAAARERLLASGFAEVLHKPIGVGALHAALRRHLPTPAGNDRARTQWDDAAALRAMGGDPAHVAALRGLFLQELPGQRQRIHAAADAADESAMRAELHRLAASCGFVGAAGLAAAVRDLQASPLQPEALHRFDAAADELLG